MKRHCMACMLLLVSFSLLAQNITVKGLLRDINTHHEISAANIFVKGTQIGTTSDINGRFSLEIQKAPPGTTLIFQHIGYDPVELPLDSVQSHPIIDLQPRIIPLQSLTIQAESDDVGIKKDLPQRMATLQNDAFEIRGYTDAADLLAIDPSVQVEEDLSGKKTVAIRGGNADEVVVLYNGVRLNSQYNSVFDLSLIDLEDVDRLEVIKGSNTALYGTGALAGLINIVPKVKQDYHIRFQQKIGTYDSGLWGLHLHHTYQNLHGSYSYKKDAYTRTFRDTNTGLKNSSEHHTGNLTWLLNEENQLSVSYLSTRQTYENQRDLEEMANAHHIASVGYKGDLSFIKGLHLMASLQNLDEDRTLNKQGVLARQKIEDESLQLHAEKAFQLKSLSMILAYQYQNARLDFYDQIRSAQDMTPLAAGFTRQHHGAGFITKYHGNTGSDLFSTMDIDISLRHDRVSDHPENDTVGDASLPSRNWNTSLIKFATQLSGTRDDMTFKAYLGVGGNVKFPTLLQQMCLPSDMLTENELDPEKNSNTELGFDLTRNIPSHPVIYGLKVSANYFSNSYNNKIVTYYTPGLPIASYFNVKTAKISGFEFSGSVFLYRKKVAVTTGYTRYNISEREAFPFKNDQKFIFDVSVNHAGFSFLFHYFSESEQMGWIRTPGGLWEVTVPGHSNFDLHLSKAFHLFHVKLMGNATIRNVLDDDFLLKGLPLHDRRIYLTLGIQY